MKLFKCLTFGLDFEKMDYFVCFLGSLGLGLEKNKVQELLLWDGLSPASIYLLCSRSLSLPNVVDAFICTFRAALMIGLKPSGHRLMWNRWMVQLRRFAKAGSIAVSFCNLSVLVPPVPHSSRPLRCFSGFVTHVQTECSGTCFVWGAFL